MTRKHLGLCLFALTPGIVEAQAKMYFSDGRGPGNPNQWRIGRMNLDGSEIEVLLTGMSWHAYQLTTFNGYIYWNNGEEIFRCGVEIPAGETPSTRTDVEQLQFAIPRESARVGMTIDRRENKLYYFDNLRLIRANPDGSGAAIVSSPIDVNPLITYFSDPVLQGVPAVGTIGMLLMVVAILSAAIVIMKRKPSAGSAS